MLSLNEREGLKRETKMFYSLRIAAYIFVFVLYSFASFCFLKTLAIPKRYHWYTLSWSLFKDLRKKIVKYSPLIHFLWTSKWKRKIESIIFDRNLSLFVSIMKKSTSSSTSTNHLWTDSREEPSIRQYRTSVSLIYRGQG